jgi:hypothetical protein
MQTNFDTAIESKLGLVGGLYDTSLNQIDSYSAGEDIPFGTPVEYDQTNKVVKKLTTTGKMLGIAMRTNYAVPGSVLGNAADKPATIITSSAISYPAGSQVSVMKTGRMFVTIKTSTQNVYGNKIFFTVGTGFEVSADTIQNSYLVGISLSDTAVADKLIPIQVNAVVPVVKQG